MLVDEVTITVKAGNGGRGAVSFRRNAQTAKGGPDGGNGGNGGSVYIKGVNDITALNQFQYKKTIKAEDGIAGSKQNKYGKNGNDLIVQVPVGTKIAFQSSDKSYEIENETDTIRIARGGSGGKGNNEFKSATNQTPRYAESGEVGETYTITLTLRLIADVGLVGFPNAGKSSLLQALTNATPKIGDYPFTTLEPNLGVCNGIILADIPGLIEGASEGKGLGIKFLKHIEKTKLIVHCIDSTQNDIVNIYKMLRKEFSSYNALLLEKPEIILLTKVDLLDTDTVNEKIQHLRSIKKDVYTVSVYDDESVDILQKIILRLVKTNEQ